MRTTFGRIGLLAALAALAVGSFAQPGDGLSPRTDAWPKLQGRLSLSTGSSALPVDPIGGSDPVWLRGVSVMGDYYLTESLLGESRSGGLRATSALLIGRRSQALGAGVLGLPGSGLRVERRLDALAAESDSGTALPYLGIGYTGLSNRGGFNFSADLGVVALTPGSPVRFGRAPAPPPSVDDTLRELRLSPMLQLGVSYSF